MTLYGPPNHLLLPFSVFTCSIRRKYNIGVYKRNRPCAASSPLVNSYTNECPRIFSIGFIVVIQFPSFALLGGSQTSGTYLLRIRVMEALAVQFGRFQRCTPILVPEGDYIYLGSALGQRGSVSLPNRLLRHASRSQGQPAHALRPQLWQDLQTIFPERPLILPTHKKLRWHVDYLLDEVTVELVQVLVITNDLRLEHELGQMLLAFAGTAVLAPGLGATDMPGNTHLLAIPAADPWWHTLVNHLEAKFIT